jgi:hypothetical protein
MRKMIVLFITSIAAIAAHAEQGKDADRLAKVKEIRLQGIDGRVSALQQEKSCIEAATTHDALKACEQASRQTMKQLEQKQKSSWESLKNK